MKYLFILSFLFWCPNGLAQNDDPSATGTPRAPSQYSGEDIRKLLEEQGYFVEERYIISEAVIENSCEEKGQVAVRVEVDRSGKVTKAIPGARLTTNNAKCLMDLAYERAMNTVFNEDLEAEKDQKGTLLFKFK